MGSAAGPQIQVTFEVDVEGLLSVRAEDLVTGSENKIVIEGSSNLGEEEVQKLVEDFEKNSEGDRVILEQYRARDNFLRVSSEIKTMTASGELTGSDRDDAEGLIDALRQLMRAGAFDPEDVPEAQEKVSRLEAIAAAVKAKGST